MSTICFIFQEFIIDHLMPCSCHNSTISYFEFLYKFFEQNFWAFCINFSNVDADEITNTNLQSITFFSAMEFQWH
jgi:hypothetical protein